MVVTLNKGKTRAPAESDFAASLSVTGSVTVSVDPYRVRDASGKWWLHVVSVGAWGGVEAETVDIHITKLRSLALLTAECEEIINSAEVLITNDPRLQLLASCCCLFASLSAWSSCASSSAAPFFLRSSSPLFYLPPLCFLFAAAPHLVLFSSFAPPHPSGSRLLLLCSFLLFYCSSPPFCCSSAYLLCVSSSAAPLSAQQGDRQLVRQVELDESEALTGATEKMHGVLLSAAASRQRQRQVEIEKAKQIEESAELKAQEKQEKIYKKLIAEREKSQFDTHGCSSDSMVKQTMADLTTISAALSMRKQAGQNVNRLRAVKAVAAFASVTKKK